MFGLDGDLYLLLLGLQIPETYLLRRWTGTVVNDFESPETSKVDPYGFGLVFVDI